MRPNHPFERTDSKRCLRVLAAISPVSAVAKCFVAELLCAKRRRAWDKVAQGFKKAGRTEDAEAALRLMENLAARYPAVLGLVTRLREMLVLAKK